MQHNRLRPFVAIVGLALIAVATLTPLPTAQTQTVAWCLICGEFAGSDFVLNVVLFVPLGAGLQLAGLSRRTSIAVAGMTTLSIETLQLQVIAGRDASLADLLANLAGAGTGIMAASTWRLWLLPEGRRATVLARTAVVLWLAILAGTGWALQRSIKRDGFIGRWAPPSYDSDQFQGVVLSATLNGKPLGKTWIQNSAEVREDLLREHVSLQASIVPGPPTYGLAAIASVATFSQSKIVLLGQERDDLVFRMRMRASDFRLRSPAIRLEDAFGGGTASGSDTMVISGGVLANRLFVETRSNGQQARREMPLTPNLGWAFFQPVDHPIGRVGGLYTATWIVVLLFPIGYWMARGRERPGPRDLRLTMLSLAAGFAFVPLLFHLPPVPLAEWLSAVAGIVAGWIVGRRTRRIKRTG